MNSITQKGKTVEEAISEALDLLGASREEVNVEVLERESAGFFGIGSKDAVVKVTRLIDNEDAKLDLNTKLNSNSTILTSDDTDKEISAEKISIDSTDKNADAEVENAYSKQSSVSVDMNKDKEEHTKGISDEEFDQKIADAADSIDEFLHKILVHFDLDEVNNVDVNIEESRITAAIDGEDCGILIGRKGETLRALQYISSLIVNKTAKTRVRFTLDIGSYKNKRKSNVVGLAKRTAERAVETGQAFELTPMSATDRRIVHETLSDFPGVVTYSEGEEPRRYVVIDLEFDENEDDDFDLDNNTERI